MSIAAAPLSSLRIDLAAFDRNIAVVRARVAPAELMLVVKNNAYGHGAAQLIRRAVERGIHWIGCLDIETALHARSISGAGTGLFAWLFTAADDIDGALAAEVDLGIGDAAGLEAVASAALRAGRAARIHLKIDTGLNRNGVRFDEWPAFIARAAQLQAEGAVAVVGVWSHISEASDHDDDAARAVFDAALAQAESAGFALELRHLAASAAAFQRPEFDYGLVRIGSFLYGVEPAGGPRAAELGIAPIASLRSRIVELREGGDRAVLPLGSWHGIPSSLAGRVDVLIEPGRLAPVTRIGSDWMELDTSALRVRAGDPVILFGSGETGEQTVTAWAETIDTIGEELLVRLDRRIPRVYLG